MADAPRIVVIGAGMAGLACAQRLMRGGAEVVVLDKGRGLGGRIATRRSAQAVFDHGAVALHASDDAARSAPWRSAWDGFLADAAAQGAAAWWPAAQAWVGLPGMSGALRPLARGLSVHQEVTVTGLAGARGGWHLTGQGVPDTLFDQVILAVPQPQALALLTPVPQLQAQIDPAAMRAVWTVMAQFDAALPIDDLIRPAAGPVGTALRMSAKPGRGAVEAWVIHAGADWTAAHLESAAPEAAARLLAAFFAQCGCDPVVPAMVQGHRWRYGLTQRPLGRAFVHAPDLGLGVCGDWCLGDRAGDAFVSGTALAAAVLADAGVAVSPAPDQ